MSGHTEQGGYERFYDDKKRRIIDYDPNRVRIIGEAVVFPLTSSDEPLTREAAEVGEEMVGAEGLEPPTSSV